CASKSTPTSLEGIPEPCHGRGARANGFRRSGQRVGLSVARTRVTAVGDVDVDLDPALVGRVAAICLALPEVHEQDAWIGVRWRIRQRTFAHLAHVDPRGGSVFGLAARLGGPAGVITCRSSGEELEALVHSGLPFYK